MDYQLAFHVDSTVKPIRWVVSLSNGQTVYENFPYKGCVPAWDRLALYCEDNDLSITNLRLQIPGTEIKLPGGQEGYIQKKVAWTTGSMSGTMYCVGYVQGDKALIYKVGEDRSSQTERGVPDPGEPWTIYRVDIRKRRAVTI